MFFSARFPTSPPAGRAPCGTAAARGRPRRAETVRVLPRAAPPSRSLSRSAGPLGDRRLCSAVPLRSSPHRARVLFARHRRVRSSAPCPATCAKCRGLLRRGSGSVTGGDPVGWGGTRGDERNGETPRPCSGSSEGSGNGALRCRSSAPFQQRP